MPSIPPLPSFRGQTRAAKQRPHIVVPTARAVVDCAVYVDGRRLPGRFTHADAMAEVNNRGAGFVWVGLHQPDKFQMADVAKTFDLHPLAVEDAVSDPARNAGLGDQSGQQPIRPKLERYDDTLFLVLRTVSYVPHEMHSISEIVETGDIMVFTGPNFAVTVRHGEHTGLAGVRRELESQPDQLMFGPGSVLHAVADHVVDSYIEVAHDVENDIEAMEQAVFTPLTAVTIESIYQLKREVVELRRAVSPLQIPLQMLGHKPDLPLPKEIRRYLRDVADHHTAVAERITEFDESLSEVVSAAVAKIAVRQNTDMRKISAWVAIAAVPTMIAGIYGMNFTHMPGLEATWGFWLVIAITLGICAGLYVNFHRNNWL